LVTGIIIFPSLGPPEREKNSRGEGIPGPSSENIKGVGGRIPKAKRA
jgi:hypothetical protein